MTLGPSVLDFVFAALVFAFGASLASFLNVVAWRVPLRQSVVTPSSRCPQCETPVPWWGLIPILGWFLVRGKCVNCKAPVSPVYPIVETLGGLGTVFLVLHHTDAASVVSLMSGGDLQGSGVPLGRLRYGFVVPLATSLWLFYTAIPLVIIDLRYRLLPDRITFPGTAVALALGCVNPALGWQGTLLGAAVGAGGLLVVAKGYEWLRGREGMGLGDVKYLALIGAVVGWQGVVLTVALASFSGALVGIAVGIVKRQGLQAAIPFGPFLALGALVVNIWGETLQRLFYGS